MIAAIDEIVIFTVLENEFFMVAIFNVFHGN